MARFRFLAHAAGVATVTAALLTAVLTSPASACSCLPSTEGQRFYQATYVFDGLVLSETLETGDPSVTYDDKYRYAVAVGQVYKANLPSQVDVVTSTSGAMCGIRLATGVRYVVFAHGDASDGRIESHYCSGTRPASAGPPVTTLPGSTTTTTPPTRTCTTATP
ncbi:hypothetical protein LZG04_14420 [Saccharothrix sp. S26]|uniref:hypothetical protein n=1 Tax=Saccharothrix sp. S26 TaxID=2907215 RepID=UPI001F391951|nr:hypothetical protein [Saccharothrix sp. S26]MCE6995989.1 hypothetical protein [Saccharothrix sp. S26]